MNKAAKVLLKEDAPESQVIPTLALANHLCHGGPRLDAWCGLARAETLTTGCSALVIRPGAATRLAS
jgi:hypothetical protein